MSDTARDKRRHAYQPEVEGLEALRFLNGAVSPPPSAAEVAPIAPGLVADLETSAPAAELAVGAGMGALALGGAHAAWDAALEQAQLGDWFETLLVEGGEAPRGAADSAVDPALRGGVENLARYLSTAWRRAGIPPQKFDDCSQAVFMTLLEHYGRERFDDLVREVPGKGIPEVFRPETEHGKEFYRAIDAAKKRAQRERSLASLDAPEEGYGLSTPADEWGEARADLREAITRVLNPREADLIQSLLAGEDASEIAERWGVAPKTVLNEKSRVLQKLRDHFSATAETLLVGAA